MIRMWLLSSTPCMIGLSRCTRLMTTTSGIAAVLLLCLIGAVSVARGAADPVRMIGGLAVADMNYLEMQSESRYQAAVSVQIEASAHAMPLAGSHACVSRTTISDPTDRSTSVANGTLLSPNPSSEHEPSRRGSCLMALQT